MINTLIHSDVDEDFIYFHDGISSTLTGSFQFFNAQGLATDTSGNLLVSSVNLISTFSGLSSTLTGSFVSPAGTGTKGITVDSNNNLIVCDAGDDIIFTQDGISITTTGSFSSPSSFIVGVTLDSNENLISSDDTTNRIYTHSGISDVLTGSFTSPDLNPRDLAMDNEDNLISCGDQDNDIFHHTGITSSIQNSFASPGTSPRGLTFVFLPENFSEPVLDTQTITDSFDNAFIFNRTLSETFTIPSDNLIQSVISTLSDNITFSDSLSSLLQFNKFLSDTQTISDSLVSTILFNRILSETLELIDSIIISHENPDPFGLVLKPLNKEIILKGVQ